MGTVSANDPDPNRGRCTVTIDPALARVTLGDYSVLQQTKVALQQLETGLDKIFLLSAMSEPLVLKLSVH